MIKWFENIKAFIAWWEVCYMKFLKKHKLFSFAVISFFILTGANFYMIYELIRMGMKIIL